MRFEPDACDTLSLTTILTVKKHQKTNFKHQHCHIIFIDHRVFMSFVCKLESQVAIMLAPQFDLQVQTRALQRSRCFCLQDEVL